MSYQIDTSQARSRDIGEFHISNLMRVLVNVTIESYFLPRYTYVH